MYFTVIFEISSSSALFLMRISIIGSGNVATALAKRMYECGHTIDSIFSREYNKADKLAALVEAVPYDSLQKLPLDSEFYLLAVKDDAIREVAGQIKIKKGLIAHSSGATAISIFEGIQDNYGVLYPLQTFSSDIAPDFEELPLCISANNSKNSTILKKLAESISPNVYSISEEQRQALHVAAVFANNFSNFLFAVSQEICRDNALDFDMLKPLIRQTLRKIEIADPIEIQTGPARRADLGTINRHLSWLNEHAPEYEKIYDLFSDLIKKEFKNK